MHAALGKLTATWMAAHPFTDRLPEWLTPPHRTLDAMPADAAAARVVMEHRSDIDAHVNRGRDGTHTNFKQRRLVGERIAEYLQQNALLTQDHALKLQACRHGGAWGVDGGTGKVVIAWDSKCGLTLLCPHCSRTEQRRLVKRYKEPMKVWQQKRSTRRVHSGVMTWPNVTPGDLAVYLRLIFKHFARVAKAFPSIKGYLATVEAPLAERGDWNLHLNVLLCVDGPFHWKDFGVAWHQKTVHLFPGYEGTRFQFRLEQLPRYDLDALDAALRELIKYPAKHVTEKGNGSKRKQDAERSGADGGAAAIPGCGEDFSGDGPAALEGDARDALAVENAERRPGDPDAGAQRRHPGRDHGLGVDDADGAAARSGVRTADGDHELNGEEIVGTQSAGPGAGAGDRARGGGCAAGQAGSVAGVKGAPPMIDWPPERFLEWWEAHRRYRRTRSYGCLFGEHLVELSGDIEDRPRGEVTWYGRIGWDVLAQAYAVSGAAPVCLIQANKSLSGDRPPGGDYRQSRSGLPPPELRGRQLETEPENSMQKR